MANSDRSTHEETDQANGLARRKESRRGLSDAVPEFTFDCTGIGSKDTFWERFLVFIGAMDDHGTNLDALCDSMGGGCSDVLNPPYVLTMTNTSKAEGGGLKMINYVAEFALEEDLAEMGVVVRLVQ